MPESEAKPPENAMTGRPSFFRELGTYLWQSRSQWLYPLLIVLLLIGAVVVIVSTGSGTSSDHSSGRQSYR